MHADLPTLFIGSSSEALPVAKAAKELLSVVADVTLWTDDDKYKKVNEFFLDSLVAAAGRHDFALLIFGNDDVIDIRGREQKITRDNVLFELGLFWSQLGRARTFVLAPKSAPGKYRILSDLQGLTLAEYIRPRSRDGLQAALRPACVKIVEQIRQLDRREGDNGPRAVSDVGKPLADLMRTAQRRNEPVFVRNIALDMEATWPLVRDQILAIDAVRALSWHTLMVDSTSPGLEGYWSDTVARETASTVEAHIKEFCAGKRSALDARKIDFQCRAYPTPPTLHGFLFNDATAFVSLCAIRDGRLIGAPNPYLRVDQPRGGMDGSSSAHLLKAFESWFDHHWTHDARAIWPPQETR